MEPSEWIGKRVRFKNGRQLDLGTVIRAEGVGRREGARGRGMGARGVNVTTRADDGRYQMWYAEVLEVVPDTEAHP